MKRIQRPFLIISLLFIVLTFSCCSEDDSSPNRAPEDSFLGINEKIAFETRDELIFRFLNSTINPFEQFKIQNEPVQCFTEYRNFAEAPFWFENFQLLENTNSTLKISYTDIRDSGNPINVVMEFTIAGNGRIDLRWNESEAPEDNWVLSQTGLAYTDYEHDCN